MFQSPHRHTRSLSVLQLLRDKCFSSTHRKDLPGGLFCKISRAHGAWQPHEKAFKSIIFLWIFTSYSVFRNWKLCPQAPSLLSICILNFTGKIPGQSLLKNIYLSIHILGNYFFTPIIVLFLTNTEIIL